MIKVEILTGSNKGELGLVAGFVVKEELYTYVIVIVDNELREFKMEELEVINN